MPRKKQPLGPESKILSAEDLRSGVRKIERRIRELKEFDVSTVQERFDSKMANLANKVNSTLADIFGRDTPEYHDHSINESFDTLPITVGFGSEFHINEIRGKYQKSINDSINNLTGLKETLEEKLEDLEEETLNRKEKNDEKRLPGNRKIFIVHGHDEFAKQAVARFITQLELSPVILHEEPNKGLTIIEKLEANTIVDFAVVLLTPDDIGYPVNEESRKSKRARQNVILELGLFLGLLGRARVCALYIEGVEIPSDYQGVIFTPMDNAGAWKLALAREIRQAGIDIDMNRAL